MSEFEDRQDAAPAIDTPATGATAPVSTAPAVAETPNDMDVVGENARSSDQDDLEAIAAVEGIGSANDDADDAGLAAVVDVSPRDLPLVYPEVSDAVATRSDAEDAPLLDDAIEDGIASVFAALQAAARDGEIGLSDEPPGPLSDDEATDGITFRLLGELDRLWHRAA